MCRIDCGAWQFNSMFDVLISTASVFAFSCLVTHVVVLKSPIRSYDSLSIHATLQSYCLQLVLYCMSVVKLCDVCVRSCDVSVGSCDVSVGSCDMSVKSCDVSVGVL